MKKTSCILGLLLISVAVVAQNPMEKILASIEENNTTLKALRKTLEARKLENNLGTCLPDPELSFNYLWGSPSTIGNRTDLSFVQSIDYSTLSGMKSRMAKDRNHLVEWNYRFERMVILLEARKQGIELIYLNATKRELSQRLLHAEALVEAYRKRLEHGDANLIEYNKSRMNLAATQASLTRIEVERTAALSRLNSLNAEKAVELRDDQFPLVKLSADFESWFAHAAESNPLLAYVKQEVEVRKKQVSLTKSMNLPSLTAGYMSEKVVGQTFQGVFLGLSLPLWENKKRVLQAKAELQAAEAREADSRQRVYGELKVLFDRMMGFRTLAATYRETLRSVNSSDLLKKALEAGQISLLDYLQEVTFYYDLVDKSLEAERDFQLTLAELNRSDL